MDKATLTKASLYPFIFIHEEQNKPQSFSNFLTTVEDKQKGG
jgi:hypothetical protein